MNKKFLSALTLYLFCYGAYVAYATEPADTIHKDSISAVMHSPQLTSDAYSVSLPEFPYKSPEAAAFRKYGEYAMDGYTGTPEISVPLYTLHYKDIDVPLFISYDAGGIKVAQEATSVGLGWSMNAGGCINYVCEGGDDHLYGRRGSWQEDYYPLLNSNPAPNFVLYDDFLSANGTHHLSDALMQDLMNGECERDFYSVTLPGKSFLLMTNCTPLLQSGTVIPDYSGQGIHSIVSNSEWGIEKKALTSINTEDESIRVDIFRSSRRDLPGSSKIDRIKVSSGVTGSTVKDYHLSYSYFTSCMRGGNYMAYPQKQYYSQSDLDATDDRLKLRLRLDSISELSTDGKRLTTGFIYYAKNGGSPDKTHLPLKTSCATDFWGYYNGEENKNTIPNSGYTNCTLPKPSLLYVNARKKAPGKLAEVGGANRYANPLYMLVASLSEIRYPTGGRMIFEFEPSRFQSESFYPSSSSSNIRGNEYSIADVNYPTNTGHKGEGPITHREFIVDRDSYGELMVEFSGKSESDFRKMADEDANVSLITITSKGTSLTKYPLREMSADFTKLSFKKTFYDIDMPAGKYEFDATLPVSLGEFSRNGGNNYVGAKIKVRAKTGDTSSGIGSNDSGYSESCGGGLRIRSVSNYDSNGALIGYSEYKYVNDKGTTSGCLLVPLRFTEDKNFICFETSVKPNLPTKVSAAACKVVRISSNPVGTSAFTLSTAHGTVGYSRTLRYDYNAAGKLLSITENTYHNEAARNLMDEIYMFDNLSNGSILSKAVLSPDSVPLVRTEYAYRTQEADNIKCNMKMEDRWLGNYGGYVDYIVGNPHYKLTVYSYKTQWNVLDSVTEKTLFKNGTVTQTAKYDYNTTNHNVSREMHNGKDKCNSYTIAYRYPCDLDDEVSQVMADNFILAKVVGQDYTVSGKVMKSRQNGFKIRILRDRTMFLSESVSIKSGDGTMEKRLICDYNDNGNLLSAVKDDTYKLSYLWSYCGSLPVSEINGMTHGEVLSVVSGLVSELSRKKVPAQTDLETIRIKLAASEKPLQMSGYLYNPGIGLISAVSPNGNTSSYKYDSFNQLCETKDNNGHIVSTYAYQYSRDDNHIAAQFFLDAEGNKRVLSLQYYDGLGRPVQTTSNGIGGNGVFVSEVTEYDGISRVSRQWLPFVTGPVITPMNIGETASLSKDTYDDDRYAYSVKHYDALGRITEMETPGEAWHSAHKVISKEYVTNGKNDVKLYTAPMDGSCSLVKSGYYEPCMLYGEKTTDEDGHSLTVFTDKLGRKVLERRNSDNENNDTYFVYNDLSQLRFVLSPQYQKLGREALFCYEYRYDNRGNIVKKILPQCQYVRYWYDNADRLIFMQDGRMRTQGKFRFYLYDNLSRVVIEGLCTGCNREKTVTHTSFNSSQSGFLGTGYTMSRNLSLKNPQIEIANYYDDYKFLNLPLFKSNTALDNAATPADSVCSIGFQTGKITATSSGELLLCSTYYDIKGNVLEVHSTLPESTLLVIKTTYSFTDNPNKITQTLYKGGKTYTTTMAKEYNQYNDKPSTTTVSISNSTAQQVSNIGYDNLGRIKSLTQGGLNGTSYSYNLRGWMTDIVSKNFEEHLIYNANSQGSQYYNGNVSTQQWKTAADGVLRGYKFIYDRLNRLTSAVYGEGTSFSVNRDWYNEYQTYNANGAIKNILRNGLKQNGRYGAIDSLEISLNGNQLLRVDDNAAPVLRNGTFDFYDNKINTSNAEYKYDENGALIYDANRGIISITYDLRNNPTKINFSDGCSTEFVYTVYGDKLKTIHYTPLTFIMPRKIHNAERSNLMGTMIPSGETILKPDTLAAKPAIILKSDSVEYIANFILENGKLDKCLFNGGYYTYYSTGKGNTHYHYYIFDHLGNNRMVVNGDGTIEQVTHYYPFGAPFADSGKNPDFQKYKYTGKELDLTHGLNTYDHGARQNYSLLSVWDRMDPMAEKYYNISPYAVCGNNPILSIDNNGCEIRGVTIDDASKVLNDIREMFDGEEFSKFRQLIVLSGKHHHGKSISKITDESVDAAFKGITLKDDQKALVEIVVNTINSSDIHMVEYAAENGYISSKGTDAYQVAPALASLIKDGRVPTKLVIADGGGGLTMKTAKGTHSIIVNNTKLHPNGISVTVGHEIFGHGRSLALSRIDSQDIDAIQVENLILRVKGINFINNGNNHGTRRIINNATEIPSFR